METHLRHHQKLNKSEVPSGDIHGCSFAMDLKIITEDILQELWSSLQDPLAVKDELLSLMRKHE